MPEEQIEPTESLVTKTARPGRLTADEVCDSVGRRVRELRVGMGLTMEQFADAAGLSTGMLSKVEHGQTSPSFSTLIALADAAEVPFTAFFRGLDEERDAVVVPAGQGMEIIHEGAGPGRVYRDLGSLRGPTREIESLYVTITEPDEVFPLFQHGGVEFIYILEGCVEYGYGTKRYLLQTGDSMQFRGEVTHGPTALIDLPLRFLSLKVAPPPDPSPTNSTA
ncbi:MAG: XRE family transcriptional regulator [Acidimicrobiaceae bacterium]|nr:XRE family transcriptional regulator [Acidimicrobiaceae bacterium]